MIDLNLHAYQEALKTRKYEERMEIFDPIRKKYLVLQPEELVRQLMVHYLIDLGYGKGRIQVERGINVNGMQRRFDIIIYDNEIKPLLLVECKSHKVPISQSTFDQIAQYNMEVKAPYLVVTNGVQTYCCALDFESKKIQYLSEVPLVK